VAGRSGIINFSLGNNVEMKVLDKKDSTGTKQNKVKLLESLNLSTSYDIFKDSLNLSPISLTGRTTILNQFNINFRGQFNAYAADSIIKNNRTMYQTVNALEITRSGKPLRLTSADFSLGFQLPLKSTQSGTQQQKATPNPSMTYDDMPDFQGKWNLNVEYVFQYNKPYFKSDITQSLRLRGGISLTEKWKADFSTGYDFVKQVFTYTSFSLNRDLHCWVMRIEVVPFGERKSYTFTLAAKASLLKDVKYMKQKSWMDN
jgi:hypothetical protein